MTRRDVGGDAFEYGAGAHVLVCAVAHAQPAGDGRCVARAGQRKVGGEAPCDALIAGKERRERFFEPDVGEQSPLEQALGRELPRPCPGADVQSARGCPRRARGGEFRDGQHAVAMRERCARVEIVGDASRALDEI